MAMTPEEAAKQLEFEQKRIQAFLTGITRGLNVAQIEALANAFGGMAAGVDVTTGQIIDSAKAIEKIATEALGVRTREAIDKAKINLQALADKTEGSTSAISKAYIRQKQFELELEGIKNAKLVEQNKGFTGAFGATVLDGQAKILTGMQKIFGTQMASMAIGALPFIGAAIAAVAALQFLFNQAKVGATSFGSSWASAGGMASKSAAEYIGMTARISQGYNDVTQVGYTATQASNLVKSSMSAMSWTLGWSAVQSEHYTGTLVEQTIVAANRTRELVLDMGRMSQAMFGTTEEVKRFVAVAGVYNITTKEGIKILGTGIGSFASKMHLDAGMAMDTMTNMGNALMGTQANIGTVSQSFVKLSESMGKMNESGKISNYEMVQMQKGIADLAKGVNTFTYMAASGHGDLEKYYETAVGTNAIQKTKSIIDRATREGMSTVGVSIASGTWGIFSGMEEGLKLRTIEAFKGMDSNKIKNMSENDVLRDIFKVKPGEEDVYSRIASAELIGHDIQSQILGSLMKLVGLVTNGFLGLLRGKNTENERNAINQLNVDKTMAVTSGSSQYASMNWAAAQGKK